MNSGAAVSTGEFRYTLVLRSANPHVERKSVKPNRYNSRHIRVRLTPGLFTAKLMKYSPFRDNPAGSSTQVLGFKTFPSDRILVILIILK